MNSNELEELRWRKFPVLNGEGFVALVDWMGSDASVVQAARVSYGAGTKQVSDDATLIRFLYRHQHLTPFEMCEIKLIVRVPMDCWRQWIRHRTASVNEYSTRYSEAIDACQTTPPDKWRVQAANNKQGSSGFVTEWPEGWHEERIKDYTTNAEEDGKSAWMLDELNKIVCGAGMTPGSYLSEKEKDVQGEVRRLYEERLEFGVAREQARKDLPLSTMTEAYWKCDLRNLLGFLSLRMDSHAQQEIREYATIIGEQIVAKLFPICWRAFLDYDQHMGGLLLSALDIKAIQCLLAGCNTNQAFTAVGWPAEGKSRERDECQSKLQRLNILPKGD